MPQHLFDSPPRVFSPDLATALGLSEAIVLQQVHYWLQRSRHQRDGRTWVYNSYAEWQREFPWWSLPTIRRIFARLEDLGILVTSEYNRRRGDRTKWYAIAYDNLPSAQPDHMGHQNDPTISSERSDHLIKTISSLPKRSTDNSTTEERDEPPAEQILALYQQHCSRLHQPSQGLTLKRRKRIDEAWAEQPSLDYWEKVFTQAGQSDFLAGQNDRGWKATLDWLLSHSTEVLEGNYDTANQTPRCRDDYTYSEPDAPPDGFFNFLDEGGTTG